MRDDLDGSDADETVSLTFDGVEYEIDLSTHNADALREFLAPYCERAFKKHRVKRTRTTTAATTTAAAPAASSTAQQKKRNDLDLRGQEAHACRIDDPKQRRLIREWARENGYAVSHRGYVPAAIQEAYREANGAA